MTWFCVLRHEGLSIQSLLIAAQGAASEINMMFHTSKTVDFNTHSRNKHVANSFPAFTVCGCQLMFANHFKYLGTLLTTPFLTTVILTQVKNLFTRTSVLCRRF